MKDKQDFLFDVIKRYDHYIGTTNFKVGLMMSFMATIILGLTLRVMSLEVILKSCNYTYYFSILFTIATIVSSLIVVINLFRAVFPNITNDSSEKSLIFFGDVETCQGGSEGYLQNIKDADLDFLLKDLATQTFSVAGVVSEKFRLLKIAVNITVWGVIPLLATTLILLVLQGVK